MIRQEFTAIIRKSGAWYVAFIEEIPGVNTQGRTLAEVRRNLREALRLLMAATPCARAPGRHTERPPRTHRRPRMKRR